MHRFALSVRPLASLIIAGLALVIAQPAAASIPPDSGSAPDNLSIQEAAVGARAARAPELFRCVDIEGLHFCTDIGFVDPATSPLRSDASLRAAMRSQASSTGALDFAGLVNYLATLDATELADRHSSQVEAAKESAGKVLLVDYMASGTAVPAGFFTRHPALGIAEDSDVAVALQQQGAVTLQGDVTVTSVVPYPSSRYIMGSYLASQIKQETSSYCGPATMQVIDWADDGTRESQTYWAGRLGYTGATALSSIVNRINTDTKWDDKAGAYSVVSVVGKNATWFKSVMQYNVGLQGAPVVMHPTLRTQFFGHIKFDHGGHFQTGRGYDSEKVYFIEPYNEKDFYPSTGAYSAGYRSVLFQKMLDATLYSSSPALRTIGY